jgi:hypothetical protein
VPVAGGGGGGGPVERPALVPADVPLPLLLVLLVLLVLPLPPLPPLPSLAAVGQLAAPASPSPAPALPGARGHTAQACCPNAALNLPAGQNSQRARLRVSNERR